MHKRRHRFISKLNITKSSSDVMKLFTIYFTGASGRKITEGRGKLFANLSVKLELDGWLRNKILHVLAETFKTSFKF